MRSEFLPKPVTEEEKQQEKEKRKQRQKDGFRNNRDQIDLEIITKDLLLYLHKIPAKNQSATAIASLLEELNDQSRFPGLEVIEKFQIVNLVPKNIVNLYAIVEECDLRFNEQQCEEILSLVAKYFPEEFKEAEAAAAAEEAGEDEDEAVEFGEDANTALGTHQQQQQQEGSNNGEAGTNVLENVDQEGYDELAEEQEDEEEEAYGDDGGDDLIDDRLGGGGGVVGEDAAGEDE